MFTANGAKTVNVPSLGHLEPLIEAKNFFLASVGVSVANTDRAVVIEIPVESHTSVERHVLNFVRKGGAKRLARLLAHIPDKTKSIADYYCIHPQDDLPKLSKAECELADCGRLWMPAECILELPDSAIEEPFLAAGYPGDRPILAAYEWAQARLSTATLG